MKKNLFEIMLTNNLVPILTIISTVIIAYFTMNSTNDTINKRLEKLEKTPPSINYEVVNRIIKTGDDNLEKILTTKINGNKELVERDIKNVREILELELKAKRNSSQNPNSKYLLLKK